MLLLDVYQKVRELLLIDNTRTQAVKLIRINSTLLVLLLRAFVKSIQQDKPTAGIKLAKLAD